MHGPSLGIETFLCNDDDGHTKILLSGFKICCGCMGWPEWEWDFLAWNFFQSAPDYNDKYLIFKAAADKTTMHAIINRMVLSFDVDSNIG